MTNEKDIKIREALERIRYRTDNQEAYACGICVKNHKDSSETLALLTAEPEPREDARELARAILLKYRTRTEYDVLEASREIASFASQVAAKRAEELRAQVASALAEIKQVHPQSKESRLHRDNTWCILDEALAATEPRP